MKRNSSRKRIEIKEREIPNLEIRVLDQSWNPIGDYSIQNFVNKYMR
jgi:hypothetical protein